MNGKIKYEFSTAMWKHDSPGGWHFVSMPKNLSKEIREHFGWQEEGWGRLKALAEIKELQWETAIWFDTSLNAYLLPVKAEIRKKLGLNTKNKLKISIWV